MDIRQQVENNLAQMESHPEFPGLSYEEQQEARSYLIGKTLGSVPEFRELGQGGQIEAISYITGKRAPVLKDQRAGQVAEELFRKAEDGTLTKEEWAATSANRGLFNSSLIPHAVARPAAKMADALLGWTNSSRWSWTDLVNMSTGTDADKIEAHMNNVLTRKAQERAFAAPMGLETESSRTDPNKIASAGQTGKVVGGAVGFAGDFLLFHGGWEKMSGHTIRAAGNKIAMSTKGAAGTYIGKIALPAFASGTSSGAFGVFKENFLGVLNDDDERRQDSFKKIAKTFGSYALLDYALNLTVGIGRHALLFKRFGAPSGAKLKAYSPEEINRVIKIATEGELPAELVSQYDPTTLKYIQGMADIQKAAGNASDTIRLRPYDDLLLEGNSAGMVIRQDPETGIFTLFSQNKDKALLVEEVPDILTAKRRVSKGLWERAEGMKEGKEEFLKQHRNMLQYELSEKLLDGSMDPTKVKGLIDPETAKALKKPVKKGFISPINRPYVGINEADSYAKLYGKEGGFAAVIRTDVPEESLEGIAKGGKLFDTNLPVTVDYSEGGQKAFVMLRNPAPLAAYEEATSLAQKAIARGSALSEDSLRSMYLMEAGFDGLIINRSKVQAFYPDKIKLVADNFDPYTGRIGAPTKAPATSDLIDVQGTASRSYNATVTGKAFTQNDELVRQAAASFRGPLKGSDVENFSKLVLSDAGIDSRLISVKVSKATDAIDSSKGFMAYTRFKDGKAVIEIPGTISTPKAQKKFIKELFEELNNVSQTLGKSAVQTKAPRLTGKFLAQFKSPFTDPVQSEKWLSSLVRENLKGKFSKTASGFLMEVPGKPPINTKTIGEATDRLLAETMDIGYLRFDLAKKGYTISQSGTLKEGYTFTVRGKSLTEPVTGRSVNEIMDKLNYRPDKLSNTMAPRIAAIDPTKVDVSFEDGIAIGSKRSLKKLFSNFEDTNKIAQSKKLASFTEGDVLLTPSGSYEVHMPEFGIIESFDSPKAARSFVTGKWKEQASLEAIADRKGLAMWTHEGIRKVSDGKTTFLAKTDEDLYKIFKEYPDTTGGPDLLGGLDADSLNAVDSVLHKFDMSQLPIQETGPFKALGDINMPAEGPIANMGLHGELKALTENMDYWAQSTLPKMGLDGVLKDYRRLEVAYKGAMVDIQRTDDALRAIFQGSNKKIIPLERRRAIFYHAGAQGPEEALEAFTKYGELSGEEQTMMQNMKKLMGEVRPDGTVSGLAGKFGIKPEEMIDNYMPRIKDYALSHMDDVNKMTSAEEILEATFQNKYGSPAPAKLKAFFKNMRTSEVLNFAVLDDPVQALQHYNRIGHRQFHMGRAWETLYDGLKKTQAPLGVVKRFERYRELIMGMSSTSGAETAGRIGEALGKKLGLKGGKDLANAYFTVNYLSNMAYRPWLAVRNTTQVWTTLAPRFGNHWVSDAIKKVNELGEDGYEYLKKIGVIFDAPPIVNDIMDIDTGLGKLTRKGLNMFKRSDDITRAVAYHTGTVRFDSALLKYKKGILKNADEFLKEAGITKMDDNTISEVRRLFTEGSQDSINGARSLFGQRIVSETMFEYRSAQSPTLFTGSFWGKLFGQYGTYAAGYRANLMRGLSQGTFADKAAFTARFLGNQAALYAAFRAVGVNAKNFIPGSPALFGGGPQFEVAVALAEGMAPDYRGQQARAKLARKFSPVTYTKSRGFEANFPEMLPGSLQLRYAQKSLEYLEQGDYWRAFLAATTTPVFDPE